MYGAYLYAPLASRLRSHGGNRKTIAVPSAEAITIFARRPRAGGRDRASMIQTPSEVRMPIVAAARKALWRPTFGSSTNPPTNAPAIAPSVFDAYTRAASGPAVRRSPVAEDAAEASARGNAAPRAHGMGRSNRATAIACRVTTRPNAASGSATCEATISGSRDAANQPAADAATAVIMSIAPSQVAGRDERRARRAPAAAPIVRPMMKEATTVVNAYVVGPTTSTRSRVQATSLTSATNPEMAAAAVATRGSAGVNVERGARSARRESLGVIFGFCGGCPASSVSIVVGRDASQIAPPAATPFSAMPIHVVARRPMAGRSQKPVATAPSAAPAVFAAYS